MTHQTARRWFASIILAAAIFAALGFTLNQLSATRARAGRLLYPYPGSAPCDGSLQACIDGLLAGDAIEIQPGTYITSVTLNKAVSLIGLDPRTTVLQALSSQRVLTVTGATIMPSTVISGLTFTGGSISGSIVCPDYCGGGILIENMAQPILEDVVISGNQAPMGGGLYIDTGGAQFLGGEIANNAALQSGGGVYVAQSGSSFDQLSGVIKNNAAVDGAGVFVQDGVFNQTGGDNFNNHATNWGGGLLVANTIAVLNGGEIVSNTADVNGGGIYVDLGRVDAINVHVISNTASNGGGASIASRLCTNCKSSPVCVSSGLRFISV